MPIAREKGGFLDYREYDAIQADLGSLGDELRSRVKEILNASNAQEETKELAELLCNEISKTVDAVALDVSRALRASIKE